MPAATTAVTPRAMTAATAVSRAWLGLSDPRDRLAMAGSFTFWASHSRPAMTEDDCALPSQLITLTAARHDAEHAE